jgi:hypothetical protein
VGTRRPSPRRKPAQKALRQQRPLFAISDSHAPRGRPSRLSGRGWTSRMPGSKANQQPRKRSEWGSARLGRARTSRDGVRHCYARW